MSSLFFMVTITDRRSTDAFLQLYESHGVDVSLRTVGSGTAVQETLSTLGLERTEKAVLMAVVTEETWQAARRDLRRKLRIDVPGTGIAFTVPLSSIGGKSAMNYLTSGAPSKAPEIDIEEDHTMKEAAYQLIVAIANQGYTDKVMEAARSAGARGGTIVHTRSTGAEDAGKFFGMSIAEEREMIFIVAPTGEKNAIMQAIMAQAGPSTKAQAITLSLALEDVVGLFTTNPDQ